MRRIAGPDRYATAAAIASTAIQRWERAGATVADEVLLASGTAFPDALAAGPYVAATRTPMLLTDPGHLPGATRDALADRRGADVVAVGGPGAISDAVLDATGRSTRRIAGPDRYDTARQLAAAAVARGADATRTLVASGETFPDALGAGGFVVHTGDVLVLTARGVVPAPTRAWLSRADVRRALVAGGRVAVDQAVVDEIHRIARG